MRKFIQNKLKEQKGLTLIELLAVIVILAIIAAIAIPAIGNVIENSRVGAMKADNLNALSAAELYIIDNPNATEVTLSNLTNKTITPGTNGAADTVTVTTAGAPVYMEDAGSLKTFSYTVATKTIASTAKVGKMNLTLTGATKANVNAYTNSTRGAGSGTAANVAATKDSN